MPQPIQAGTVADRLRNFLKLSGRIPVQMDENVVPVVTAQQLDQPPWRTEVANFHTETQTSAAVAARFSMLAIRAPSGMTGVGRCLKALVRTNVAAEYKLMLWSNIENEGTIANFTVQDRAVNTERLNLSPAGAFERVPLDVCTFDGSDTTIGFELARVSLPIASNWEFNYDVCIRGKYTDGRAQSQGLVLTCLTVNTSLTCSFWGTYFPQAI
jgi:hypothetical protein